MFDLDQFEREMDRDYFDKLICEWTWEDGAGGLIY